MYSTALSVEREDWFVDYVHERYSTKSNFKCETHSKYLELFSCLDSLFFEYIRSSSLIFLNKVNGLPRPYLPNSSTKLIMIGHLEPSQIILWSNHFLICFRCILLIYFKNVASGNLIDLNNKAYQAYNIACCGFSLSNLL